MSRFYTIPGNEIKGSDTTNFLGTQNLAMRVGPNILSQIPAAAASGLEWDVVSLPILAGNTSGGTQMIAPFYAIPGTGQNQDDAFQVMAYLLSDEVQMIKSKSGRIPIVRNENAIKAFAADLEGMQGKNLAAFFKDTIGKPIKTTRFDGIAKDELYKSIPFYAAGGKDANTIMRETEEAVNKKIEEELKK